MAQFRMNGERMLEVDLMGDSVKAVTGSMVAYDGRIDFKKASFGGAGGMGAHFKRKLTGEAMSLMECTGQGTVYFALNAQEVFLIHLQGEQLQVESQNLLALDPMLQTNVVFTGVRGATQGQGLFTTTVQGMGTVAVTSDGPAIQLEVSPQFPLVVDPDAFVCARGQMQNQFITDVSWKTMVGADSGESFQIRWTGQGVVYIQPAERGGTL